MRYLTIILLFITTSVHSQHHSAASIMPVSSITVACDTIITQDTTITNTADTLTLYNNLVAWWDMEETTGTTMTDSFGSLNGTIGGSVTLNQTGGQGKGYDFAYASGNSVSISDNDNLSFTDESFTVSVWVTPDYSTYATRLFSKSRNNSGYEYDASIYSGRVELKLYDNNTTTVSTYLTPVSSITDDALHHIVFVVKSGALDDVEIYINGVSQTLTHTDNNTSAQVNSNADFYIGLLSGVGWSDMMMSQLIFWSDTISSLQVDTLYNSASGINYAGLFTGGVDTVITVDTTFMNCPGSTPESPASTNYYSTYDYIITATGNGDSLSLAEANATTFVAGDTINIMDDIEGELLLNNSGTSGNPIVLRSHNKNSRAKIYGSDEITGWSVYSGNIYRASYAGDVTQLFVNDERMTMARYPNSGYHTVTGVTSSTVFTSTDLDGGTDYSGATVAGKVFDYRLTSQTVSSSSSQTITLSSTMPGGSLGVDEGFYLVDKLDFLDVAGEWYCDTANNYIYLWTTTGLSPSNYTVRGTVHDNGIHVTGDYVNIESVAVYHSGLYGILLDSAHYVNIDTVKIHGTKSAGIYLNTGDYNNVRNCNIYDAMTGISCYGATGTTISYDTINYTGQQFDKTTGDYYGYVTPGDGIITYSGNVNMRYNRITNTGMNGISFNEGTDTIQYNYINNSCVMLKDGGNVYCYVDSITSPPGVSGSLVDSNVLLNSIGNSDGASNTWDLGYNIYLDNGSRGVTVTNNVCGTAGGGLFLNTPHKDIIVKNNIFYDNTLMVYVNNEESGDSILNNTLFLSDRLGDYVWWTNSNQKFVYQPSSNAYFDYNTYVSPYWGETDDIFVNRSGFADWKSTYSVDANSTFDDTALTAGHTDTLFVNPTATQTTFYLNGATANDIDGNSITTSFTVEAWGGKIITGTNLNLITE